MSATRGTPRGDTFRGLKKALSLRQKRHIAAPHRTPSAVLVPLYEKQGKPYLFFIRRTERVKNHRGQICFPGGTYEENDSTLLNTALRECAEEIGLAPEAVALLGELDDVITKDSGFVISPFVAIIPRTYPFRLDSYEVAEIIGAPISALLDKNCRQQGRETVDGATVTTCSYHYQSRLIWGATARILKQLLEIWTQAIKGGE